MEGGDSRTDNRCGAEGGGGGWNSGLQGWTAAAERAREAGTQVGFYLFVCSFATKNIDDWTIREISMGSMDQVVVLNVNYPLQMCIL